MCGHNSAVIGYPDFFWLWYDKSSVFYFNIMLSLIFGLEMGKNDNKKGLS